jgi:hypothetical protein
MLRAAEERLDLATKEKAVLRDMVLVVTRVASVKELMRYMWAIWEVRR